MRRSAWVFVLIILGLASCTSKPDGPQCTVDSDCGDSLVCARPGECLSPGQVREVTATWTVNGMPAGAQTCASIEDLMIQFDGSDFNDTLGFAPVPCSQGQFHVDKLPRRYIEIELGIDGRGLLNAAFIDPATNSAQFDLVP
jgi:hypothetical protein